MKKNLNEELTRIKEVMGLNEKEIDLKNYKFVDDDDPIKEMRVINVEGEANRKVATVLIKTRVYVPNQELEDKGGPHKGIFGGAKGRQMVFDFYTMFNRSDRVVKILKIEVEEGTDTTGFSENYLDYWKTTLGGVIFKEGVDAKSLMSRIYDGYLAMIEDEEINVKMGALNSMKKNARRLENMIADAFMEHDRDNPLQHPQRVKEPEVKDEPKMDVSKGDMWTSTSSWASE